LQQLEVHRRNRQGPYGCRKDQSNQRTNPETNETARNRAKDQNEEPNTDSEDQVEDHDHSEYLPSAAADEFSAPAEGVDYARTLDDDDRSDDRPDRRKKQPEHEPHQLAEGTRDEADQPRRDLDGERNQDACTNQRQDGRRRRLEELSHAQVATAILHVPDDLHHHALVEVKTGQRDKGGEECPEQDSDPATNPEGSEPEEKTADDSDGNKDDERGGQNDARLRGVRLEGAAEDAANVEFLSHGADSSRAKDERGKTPTG